MRGAALIVLAWNQWQLTQRCLNSLLGTELDEAEVIVVDNGSEDETPKELVAYTDRLRVIRLPENLGFVRGMNAGMAAARPNDDVVLLNNDLVFSQRDWLGRLRDAAYAAPENGIVSCRLRGPQAEGRIYHTGCFIEPEELWTHQTESGLQERDVNQYTRIRKVQYASFAVAYIRRDCLARIGGLNEAFHSYFEDPDYCLRAADVGIATLVAGTVTLRHDQGGSTSNASDFRQRLWAKSKASFTQLWQERLISNYRGTLLWHGTTRFPPAYAQLTRSLLRRLETRGLRTAYVPVVDELLDAQDFRLDLAAKRSLPNVPNIALICAAGAYFNRDHNCGHRVALTFGEWDRVPSTWAEQANRLDKILVPDTFQAAAFRKSGVYVPIEIFPLGIDCDYFHLDVSAPRHPLKHFVFVAIVESFARDAPDVLVEAFQRTFTSDEPVELLLYLYPTVEATTIERLLRSRIATSGGRVRILTWGFPAHQKAQLLCSGDAYVSVRRGGGWDPALAEAIACGRPVIAPAFGSHAEIVGDCGHLVEIARLVSDPKHPECYWAEPNSDSLAEQLHVVYRRRAECVLMARKQANAFAVAHDLDASADHLVELLATPSKLRVPPSKPRDHRPLDVGQTASGQIVVLGMHRSGTSSAGGLLALLGAWPGPNDMLMRAHDNPKGHYEHLALHMACVRRLEAAEGDWKYPPFIAPGKAIDRFRCEASAVLETLEPFRPWFIKEPRLCLLVRELLPLLTYPIFILVTRNPSEVAASLAARDGISRKHALALWEYYNVEAFTASRGYPRILLDYANLLSDPGGTAQYVFNQLSSFGIRNLRFSSSEVVDWIEVDLQHQRVHELDELTSAQRTLYMAIADRSILEDTLQIELSAESAELLANLREQATFTKIAAYPTDATGPAVLAQMYRDLNPGQL